MTNVVVPFRGSSGKTRLAPMPDDARAAVALAMLADVLDAATAVGPTTLVTGDAAAAQAARRAGARVVDDTGIGQGAAVEAALAAVGPGPVLVVNADLPAARARDLLALLGALPPDGLALAAAADGTTNALALAVPHLFEPLYGPGSAARFLERAAAAGVEARSVDVPALAADVDTLADLEALEPAVGPHTRETLESLPDRRRAVKVVLLAGGVGGARFARGLVTVVEPRDVTIVGNVGDDVEVLGLHVSPDLDTLLYTLTGRADEERGWGRAGETWQALETAAELAADAWFQLGDRDIGLHLVRTAALRGGEPLSRVTARVAAAFGLEPALLPATDDRLRTWIDTAAGAFPFQEWFVRRGHRDDVDGVRFEGAADARPGPGVTDALAAADLIVIAPSNPYVSVAPILAVPGIRSALEERRAPAVAVSPLVGGRAVKGPADRMLARLAGGTSAAHVARCYEGLVDVLVLDEQDEGDADAVAELGVRPLVTRTLMSDDAARRRLAEAVVDSAVAHR